MIYAYIRVSTDTQTVENQKLAIKAYARYHRLHSVRACDAVRFLPSQLMIWVIII